jgi:hypothetical protein
MIALEKSSFPEETGPSSTHTRNNKDGFKYVMDIEYQQKNNNMAEIDILDSNINGSITANSNHIY